MCLRGLLLLLLILEFTTLIAAVLNELNELNCYKPKSQNPSTQSSHNVLDQLPTRPSNLTYSVDFYAVPLYQNTECYNLPSLKEFRPEIHTNSITQKPDSNDRDYNHSFTLEEPQESLVTACFYNLPKDNSILAHKHLLLLTHLARSSKTIKYHDNLPHITPTRSLLYYSPINP